MTNLTLAAPWCIVYPTPIHLRDSLQPIRYGPRIWDKTKGSISLGSFPVIDFLSLKWLLKDGFMPALMFLLFSMHERVLEGDSVCKAFFKYYICGIFERRGVIPAGL